MTSALAISDQAALQQKPTQLQQMQDRSSTVALVEELARLGEARQVVVSEATFAIYSEELAAFNIEDVRTALRDLARNPRERYETAYPPLATVIQACKYALHERIKASFPPRPTVPAQLRPAPDEECQEKHHWVSGKRMIYDSGVLRECDCTRRWLEAIDKWHREVMGPYRQAVDEWDTECSAIRTRMLQGGGK